MSGSRPSVGVAVLSTPQGLGVVPAVPFPATEADRQKAANETGRAALLVAKASPGQTALFRFLSEASPDGKYVVESAQWIATIMKATKGLSEEDIKELHALDWTASNITPEELRRTVLALVKKKPKTTTTSKKT